MTDGSAGSGGRAGSAGADATVSWSELLTEAETRLDAAGVEQAAADARRIVEEVSGLDGAELTVRRGEPVTEGRMAAFDSLLARRLSGEPLQYVLGHWGFRRLDLLVDRRVLIPRPETEVLVDVALAHVDRIAARGADAGPVRVVDLGTGSGAIALSIAAERPVTSVWATDCSSDALSVARANLAGLGRAAARLQLLEGSWFEALPAGLVGAVDVIVSNPPYVTDHDPLPAEVEHWEPAGALRSGAEGLDDLAVIVEGSVAWLAPGGGIALELDPRQVGSVSEHLAAVGFVDVSVVADLAGRQRIVTARQPSEK